MNWKIALIIWAKGLGVFAGICIFIFPIGLYATLIALFISWIAIPVYATGLWIVKEAAGNYKGALTVMLVLLAPLSVGASLYLLKYGGDDLSEFVSPATFWIPLLCCLVAITISGNSIRLYLHPEEAIEEFVTE